MGIRRRFGDHQGMLLPDTRIFTLVSIVPETFGGMVTVALQRSSAFADLGRRQVDILSKSTDMADPRVRTAQLRETGQLSRGAELRNVWFELETLPDEELKRFHSEVYPLLSVKKDLLEPDGSRMVHRTAEDGTILQTDLFREDGSRAVSHRQDVKKRGSQGGRLITVFTRDGESVLQWKSLRKLYHAWVDYVIGKEDAVLIIDSAPTGGLFFDYQRENVTMIQAIHTLHMHQMRADERGQLNADVMQMLTHLDWFDAVAILTAGQERAMKEAGVLAGNSFVAPNMFMAPHNGGVTGRSRERGAVVSRLVPMKRIEHAIEAVGQVAGQGQEVHLDIFGEGSQTKHLFDFTAELGAGEFVKLQGYDPRAKEAFAAASFTLVTSRYEGQSLVLLEAMSAGCIPIAYDVPYGPRDIITDGVDGFLVPDGDIEGLATAVTRLLEMTERARNKMRRAAIRRSRDFSPAKIVGLWGDNLRKIRRNKNTLKKVPATGSLLNISLESDGVMIDAALSGRAVRESDATLIGWVGRKHDAYGRVKAERDEVAGGFRVSGLISYDRLCHIRMGAVLDIYLDVLGGDRWSRTRLISTGIRMPAACSGWIPYTTDGGNLSLENAGTMGAVGG